MTTPDAKTLSRCRSCQAPIVFARNRSNRVAPFEPDPNGEWTIENGKATHVGPAPAQLAIGAKSPRFTSHFARCPAADQWRRK